MKIHKVWLGVVALAVLGAACDDPPTEGLPPGLGNMDGGPGDAGTSVAVGNATADGSSADGSIAMTGMDAAVVVAKSGPTFAVISSDFNTSTAISILDPQGNPVPMGDNYINTGSAKAGLTTALSGDVALPKHSGETGVLVIIDRYNTDVVTRVRLSDGQVLGQVKTQKPATQGSMSSFDSNPADYIYVDEHTAWVTRTEPNVDPMPDPLDLGSDMLRIDPATMTLAGERIDLSVLATNVTVVDGSTTKQVAINPRPAHMVRLGNTVIVGAGRISSDFGTYGPGAVGIVDLTTKTATAFLLDGMKDCEGVDTIPDDTDSVLITCAGEYGNNKPTAGHVILGIANGAATVEHSWHAMDNAAALPYTSAAVSLGGTKVAAFADGFMDSGPDVFALVDVATGVTSVIVTAMPGTARWGTPAYDADSKLLLVPDSSVDGNGKPTSGIRRFQFHADNTFTELSVVQVAVASTLPAQHIFPL